VTAVNLRADLAQLSDAELAARLDEAWHQFEATDKNSWTLRGLQINSGGPFELTWLDLLVAVIFSSKRVDKLLRVTHPRAETTLRKIQDMVGEVERRVAKRQAKAS